jgi:carbonic anhydrase/acetyltransferase-like protein (isoleucine patch superfamily)
MTTVPLIFSYRGKTPKIDPRAFVAPGAVVIGDVEIGPESSVWFGCVLRGDVNFIRIGARSNIQDGTVIHTASGQQPARLGPGASKIPENGYPTIIGDDVTIGHMALLHACTLKDNSFVGMQAGVMDGAVIESHAMLAAGGLLTPGKTIAKNQLWAGTPAKYLRDLTEADIAQFDLRASQYAALGTEYLKALSGL